MIDRARSAVRFLLFTSLTSLLIGCAGMPASIPYTPPTYFAYRCPEGAFEVRLGEDKALFLHQEKRLMLLRVPSASGEKYQDAAGNLLFMKGQEALFEGADGVSLDNCKGQLVDTPWRAAAVRGVDFRAVGNEPGWLLEMDEEQGVFILLDYGTQVIKTPPPHLKIYPLTIRTEAHEITIVSKDSGCRDAMSGEYSPLTVTMTVDGKAYTGCGRRLQKVPQS
ncbi:MAG: MliC family protein [Alphaproteobacteria bacterium]|nr:MliC family protein [Alphaproteobacteria bacterium]